MLPLFSVQKDNMLCIYAAALNSGISQKRKSVVATALFINFNM